MEERRPTVVYKLPNKFPLYRTEVVADSDGSNPRLLGNYCNSFRKDGGRFCNNVKRNIVKGNKRFVKLELEPVWDTTPSCADCIAHDTGRKKASLAEKLFIRIIR